MSFGTIIMGSTNSFLVFVLGFAAEGALVRKFQQSTELSENFYWGMAWENGKSISVASSVYKLKSGSYSA